MNALDKKVHLFLQKIDLKDKNILVGFSAGADSTALLHILNKKKNFFQFNLNAVFFSHENCPMNEGEDKSLDLAKKTCSELEVNFIYCPLDMVKTPGKSWEEIGRNKRKEFYQKNEFDFVFLGHHEDDQNENTFIQLFRGAGKGISGMNPVEGKILRPFLNTEKKEIYEFLKQNNIQWIEDPTNSNIDFTRNFWRNKILPSIESHYPEYRKTLSLFRKKQKTQNILLHDLAQIDGLDILKNNGMINIKNLSKERVINLIQHLGKEENANLELKQIEAFLDKSNKNGVEKIETNNYVLSIIKDKNSKSLKKEPICENKNIKKMNI